tara:strand:+ start:4911 stop:6347 length:1437 start_codon:yes stop_codon:yes gene_type:complete
MKFKFIHKFLETKKKSKLKKNFISFLRIFVRQRIFLPFLVYWFEKQLNIINNVKKKKPIRILVLHSDRYKNDLNELAKHKNIQLLDFNPNIQPLINMLWIAPITKINWQYYNRGVGYKVSFASSEKVLKKRKLKEREIKLIIKLRKKLRFFLELFLEKLIRRKNIDAIVSCAFFYPHDQDWAVASSRIKLPFIALHKECLHDPDTLEVSKKRYLALDYKFKGTKLIVHGGNAKKLFLSSKIAPKDKIVVSGALRTDHYYKNRYVRRIPKKQITLFSFTHCTGLIVSGINYNSYFFCDNPNEGFYKYFDLVHYTIAKYAKDNPNIEVWIKPKFMQHWSDRIYTAIKRGGLNPKNISNLHISVEKSSEELINESAVIVGINSTSLIESKLMKKNVVIPIFAEAKGKYYKEHVNFKKYFNKAFYIAKSTNKLIKAIDDGINGKLPKQTCPKELIYDVYGFFDGKTKERIYKEINKTIKNNN